MKTTNLTSPTHLGGGKEVSTSQWLSERDTEKVSTAVSTEAPASSRSGDSTDAESLEELLKRVPRDAQGNLLSIGSISHQEEAQDGVLTCKPCVFAHNPTRPCENGIRCTFCHYVHPAKKRVRLCKKKRMEMKARMMQDGGAVDAEVTVRATAAAGS